MTARTWYVANTPNGQGLVVDERTGANVAVVYDPTNAPIIAAAPALLAALQNLIVAAQYGSVSAAIQDARAAIALTKGEA